MTYEIYEKNLAFISESLIKSYRQRWCQRRAQIEKNQGGFILFFNKPNQI